MCNVGSVYALSFATIEPIHLECFSGSGSNGDCPFEPICINFFSFVYSFFFYVIGLSVCRGTAQCQWCRVMKIVSYVYDYDYFVYIEHMQQVFYIALDTRFKSVTPMW